jgi:cysteine desulfurase
MIYWDNNSTSPLRPKVREKMKEAIDRYFANPSAGHKLGQESRAALEGARRTLASAMNCKPGELIFTASATESNISALWGICCPKNSKDKKILISPTEHASVHENALFVADRNCCKTDFMPVTSSGLIDLEKTEKMLNDGSWSLVSCIAANNETGIIQPWEKLATLCKKAGVPFHTDLVQYVGRLPINLNETDVSIATISFHKSGGPKGVGVLYIKEGVQIEPIIRGGSQERKLRSGTENIIPILGAAALAEEFSELNKTYEEKIRPLRDQFEKEMKATIDDIEIVGVEAPRIANTSYIIFNKFKSDALLMSLDLKDVYVSTGSACSSGMLTPSRNILALGYSKEQAISAIRFSLGPQTTADEVSKVVHAVQDAILKLAA